MPPAGRRVEVQDERPPADGPIGRRFVDRRHQDQAVAAGGDAPTWMPDGPGTWRPTGSSAPVRGSMRRTSKPSPRSLGTIRAANTEPSGAATAPGTTQMGVDDPTGTPARPASVATRAMPASDPIRAANAHLIGQHARAARHRAGQQHDGAEEVHDAAGSAPHQDVLVGSHT